MLPTGRYPARQKVTGNAPKRRSPHSL